MGQWHEYTDQDWIHDGSVGSTHQYSSTSTAALVTTGGGRVPQAMPTRLAGEELEALQAKPEMPMLLEQQDHPWLMQSVKDRSPTPAYIEGGHKMWGEPAETRGGRRTDGW